MEIASLNDLKRISTSEKTTDITLVISTSSKHSGLSLIELLSALEIIRHNHDLKLTHISCPQPNSYEFTQAIFQTRFYFPDVKVK